MKSFKVFTVMKNDSLTVQVGEPRKSANRGKCYHSSSNEELERFLSQNPQMEDLLKMEFRQWILHYLNGESYSKQKEEYQTLKNAAQNAFPRLLKQLFAESGTIAKKIRKDNPEFFPRRDKKEKRQRSLTPFRMDI